MRAVRCVALKKKKKEERKEKKNGIFVLLNLGAQVTGFSSELNETPPPLPRATRVSIALGSFTVFKSVVSRCLGNPEGRRIFVTARESGSPSCDSSFRPSVPPHALRFVAVYRSYVSHAISRSKSIDKFARTKLIESWLTSSNLLST